MKKLFLSLLIVLMTSTIVYAHSEVPDPFDNFAYINCPSGVQIPASVGKYLFMVPGVLIGGISGIVYAPFSGDAQEAIFNGLYIGALSGNIVGSTLVGAPGYGLYRIFNWNGCIKKEK